MMKFSFSSYVRSAMMVNSLRKAEDEVAIIGIVLSKTGN
jgi:hypothetical protein